MALGSGFISFDLLYSAMVGVRELSMIIVTYLESTVYGQGAY